MWIVCFDLIFMAIIPYCVSTKTQVYTKQHYATTLKTFQAAVCFWLLNMCNFPSKTQAVSFNIYT